MRPKNRISMVATLALALCALSAACGTSVQAPPVSRPRPANPPHRRAILPRRRATHPPRLQDLEWGSPGVE